MSEKKCSHQWTNECLNRTGEYIIFPSEMYHRGYYNQKSNQIFTQAQLFCAPTNDTNVLRLPRSLMKAQGQQVTQGCLDESTLSELRDDLINHWEILYSNTKYQPSKKNLVFLWTELITGRFTRNISLKYHYSRTWWIPLKLCFLIFLLTWYGCCANQKKVMGFRVGTKTYIWVDESPRLLLSMLEVK
jgi:hypothetical protein